MVLAKSVWPLARVKRQALWMQPPPTAERLSRRAPVVASIQSEKACGLDTTRWRQGRCQHAAMVKSCDVAVVGGGIAGLTAASLLAAEGLQVELLEAHSQTGGCAGTFRRGPYTFDVGATQVAGFEPGGIHQRLMAHFGVPLPAATPLDPGCSVQLSVTTLHLGLRWDHPAGKLWSEGLVTWADDADELNTRDENDSSRIPPGGTPGYTVLDLRGGYRASDAWSFTIGLENLTDEDYRIHGSGVNRPGRNLVFGVNFSF